MLPVWCGGNDLGTILDDGGIPAIDQGNTCWQGPANHPWDNRYGAGIRHGYGCLVATLPGVGYCCNRSTRWWRYGSRCGKDTANSEDHVGTAVECFIAIRARPHNIDDLSPGQRRQLPGHGVDTVGYSRLWVDRQEGLAIQVGPRQWHGWIVGAVRNIEAEVTRMRYPCSICKGELSARIEVGRGPVCTWCIVSSILGIIAAAELAIGNVADRTTSRIRV